jgi:hypothetical protein
MPLVLDFNYTLISGLPLPSLQIAPPNGTPLKPFMHWNPKKKSAPEEMLIARYANVLTAEIEEHGGEAKLAATFSKAIRETTHNERSAASTSFKKTFLSKHNAEFMWCCKVLKGGDAHGRAPLFRPVITFLPSRHRSKVDRFINRHGIIGLVGFAVPTSPIRAPLGRFRVGLMAEIPARENLKNTKTSKTS